MEATEAMEAKRERKIAIMGKSPSTQQAAPFGDESWEIWTLFNMVQCGEVPRFDRHFELHPLEWFRDKAEHDYYKWLCSVRDKPVYLIRSDEEVPAGVLYPKDEIVDRFGRYFTNTVSWMIALAIHEGATHISLWGVDMAQDTEYAIQRPSCEYFIGVAVGAGIEVEIPDASDLLKTRVLYGFETDSGQVRQKRNALNENARQQLRAFREQRDQAGRNAAYCEGALEVMKFWEQWG